MIIGILMYMAIQILGYALMGIGLRLGWALGERLLRGIAYAWKKLK